MFVTVKSADDLQDRLDLAERPVSKKVGAEEKKTQSETLARDERDRQHKKLAEMKHIELLQVMKKYSDNSDEYDAKILNDNFDDAYRELRRVMLGFYFACMKESNE